MRTLLYAITLLSIPYLLAVRGMGGTILLYNDSPFILTATIQAADGTFLGQYTIQPGQQSRTTSSLYPTRYETPGRPDLSLTPYTVIWQCPSQGFYSMCTDVTAGSLVRANDCPGERICAPKEAQKKDEKPASTLKRKK